MSGKSGGWHWAAKDNPKSLLAGAKARKPGIPYPAPGVLDYPTPHSPRVPVLATLRVRRNRPYLQLVAFVLLMSWFSLLVSATCSMPSQWRASSDVMPAGCSEPEKHLQEHKDHVPKPSQDCSFKPCFESQPNPFFAFKLDKPEMPVFILCLIGLIGSLFARFPMGGIPRSTAPPAGRRIPLIYRFCILLN